VQTRGQVFYREFLVFFGVYIEFALKEKLYCLMVLACMKTNAQQRQMLEMFFKMGWLMAKDLAQLTKSVD